jgi:hypothetical protein
MTTQGIEHWIANSFMNFGRIGYVEMGVLWQYLLCLPCPDTL